MKIIDTGGITYLEILKEGSDWYCGTDYSCGDLYEAEEVFLAGGSFTPNRVVFVHHPDGTVYEPVKAGEGEYFGRPIMSGGNIYILIVNFPEGKIRILKWDEEVSVEAVIPLSEVKDTYNLLLKDEPLMLTRQGGEDVFQIIWPEKTEFSMEPSEAFIYRKEDKLYFSKWYEDPDYREEFNIRKYPDGELIERIDGSIFIAPDGESWILR